MSVKECTQLNNSTNDDSIWKDLYTALYDEKETAGVSNIYFQQDWKEEKIDESKQFKKANNMDCTSCGGELMTCEDKLICRNCGLEVTDTSGTTSEQYTITSLQDCNVSDKGFMSMKIIGKGAYCYNRCLMRSSAIYDTYRKGTTLRELLNWNSQSTGKHLPKNIMEEANNMFSTIKSCGYVYRKDVKKGVLSACIYYACYNNGISKTPSEIAQIVGIAEKFHSMGDRILRDLNERGVIDLPDKINPIIDYVERYMEILNIPSKYKTFILDMIYVADREKLHVLSDSKNNTKCIGTIYLLIDRARDLKSKIKIDSIDKDCEISKTTFLKYYNLLCKFYRKFVPVFVKHRIPMKKEWKEDYTKAEEDTNVKIKRVSKKTTDKKLPNMAPSRARALAKSKARELELEVNGVSGADIDTISINSDIPEIPKKIIRNYSIKYPPRKLKLILDKK
jgi:hypothetical protein